MTKNNLLCAAMVWTFLMLAGCGASVPIKMTGNPTFDAPESQINVDGVGELTDSNKILVPSNWVQSMVSGEQKAYRNGAHAKATVHIGGMTSELGEEIASALYQDLIEKLENDGWQVMTYADIRNHPDLADIDLMEVDEDYGFTGVEKDYTGQGDKVWMYSSPSATPTYDLDFTGNHPPMTDFHAIAKDMGANLVWPRYMFVTPVMYSEDARGYKKSYASVGLLPALELNKNYSMMKFHGEGGGWGQLSPTVNRRLDDSVGEISQISESQTEDRTLFVFDVFRSMSKGDYSMKLDRDAFKQAALKAGKDLNTLTVEAFSGALKSE